MRFAPLPGQIDPLALGRHSQASKVGDDSVVTGHPNLLATREFADTVQPIQNVEIAACPIDQIVEEIGRATSELQSLMRLSYAAFFLKKKTTSIIKHTNIQ